MATAKGREVEAWKRAYQAYFGDQRPVFDLEDVVSLGEGLGFDAAEVRDALSSGRYAPKVDADLRDARTLGIRGVPFFAIDRRVGISGAQTVEALRRALEDAWRDRPTPLADASAEGCDEGACAVDPRG